MSVEKKKVTITVRLQPRARKNEIIDFRDNVLRARVTAQPSGGQANRALLELLALALEVPRNAVDIVHGYTSRNKVITVYNISPEDFKMKLAHILPPRELLQR